MKRIAAMLMAFALAVSTGLSINAVAAEQDKAEQVIYRAGTQTPLKGAPNIFTGNVRVDPWYPVGNGMRSVGASVTFEPGARSNWHTHPVGQALIVTSGVGLTQEWGKPIQEIRPGDVIVCPAGVKHWHGAPPNSSMTHISIAEDKDGVCVEWLEKVTDEQYGGK